MNFLAIWRVYDPFVVGVRGDSGSSFLEVWDEEKTCNSAFVEPHRENPNVPDVQAFFDFCFLIPAQNSTRVSENFHIPHDALPISTYRYSN